MQILFFLKCLILSNINLPISIITFLGILPFSSSQSRYSTEMSF